VERQKELLDLSMHYIMYHGYVVELVHFFRTSIWSPDGSWGTSRAQRQTQYLIGRTVARYSSISQYAAGFVTTGMPELLLQRLGEDLAAIQECVMLYASRQSSMRQAVHTWLLGARQLGVHRDPAGLVARMVAASVGDMDVDWSRSADGSASVASSASTEPTAVKRARTCDTAVV